MFTGGTVAIEEIRTVGYTILRGALGWDLVADLNAAVDRLLREDDETWGAERLVEIRERGALRNLAAAGAAFVPLLHTSAALDIVDALLGPQAILNCFDALTLFPGKGRFPWDYHTDLMPLTGVVFPPHKIPGVNVIYSLDRLRETNGVTWFAHATHLLLDEAPDTGGLVERSVAVEVEPGDAVVSDARIWHCAGTNHSASPRTVIKTLFTLPWFRPQMDFPRAVPAAILDGFPDRARRYLGVGIAPPTTVAELRLRLYTGGQAGAVANGENLGGDSCT